MSQPFVGDIFYGDCRTAFFKNNNTEHQLQTQKIDNLKNARMFCTTPDMFDNPQDLKKFQHLKNSCQNIRYGTDCYGYTALAAGWGHIVFESNVQNYDIYPIIPIVKGAGGYISAPDGSDFKSGSVIASSDQELHNEILNILKY